jgi:hypothetical protein
MQWSPLLIGLTIAYFLAASITTFDIRLIQTRRDGSLPPDEPMLPAWTGIFGYLMWVIFVVLLYLNWKYALLLFVIKFLLKVLPVLETIGNVLMSLFKPRSPSTIRAKIAVASNGGLSRQVQTYRESLSRTIEIDKTLFSALRNKVSEGYDPRGVLVTAYVDLFLEAPAESWRSRSEAELPATAEEIKQAILDIAGLNLASKRLDYPPELLSAAYSSLALFLPEEKAKLVTDRNLGWFSEDPTHPGLQKSREAEAIDAQTDAEEERLGVEFVRKVESLKETISGVFARTEEAEKIIHAYGRVLEQRGQAALKVTGNPILKVAMLEVIPNSLLLHPKETIKESVRHVLTVCNLDETLSHNLRNSYEQLASFIDDDEVNKILAEIERTKRDDSYSRRRKQILKEKADLRTELAQQLFEETGEAMQAQSAQIDQLATSLGEKQKLTKNSIRAAAADRLAEIQKAVAYLKDRDPRVRAAAADELGEIHHSLALEPLIGALRDGDPKVRATAAWALGRISDSRAKEPLKNSLLEDTDEKVRHEASVALQRINRAETAILFRRP